MCQMMLTLDVTFKIGHVLNDSVCPLPNSKAIRIAPAYSPCTSCYYGLGSEIKRPKVKVTGSQSLKIQFWLAVRLLAELDRHWHYRLLSSGQIVKSEQGERFPLLPLPLPPLSFFLTPSFPSLSPSLPLPPLEVGPLNPARVWGAL